MKELSYLSSLFSIHFLPKSFCADKGKSLTKPYLDLGLVHHVYSVKQESWRKNNIVSYYESQTEVAQENLHSDMLNSSVLTSFAFMEFPTLLTKTIWKENWKCDEVSSSHLPGVLAVLGLLDPANLFSTCSGGRLSCVSSVPAESLLLQQLFLIMPG